VVRAGPLATGPILAEFLIFDGLLLITSEVSISNQQSEFSNQH
jgi:hypothetical protein